VAELVVADRPMADIGTDHGLLPLALIESGLVPHAFGCDLRHRPLGVAEDNVSRAAWPAGIELRRGDGFAPVADVELGTATIAGMGGRSMVGILERGPVDGVKRLVLAPNEGAELVRRGLWRLGMWIVEERVVADQGRYYVVLAAERPAPRVRPSLRDFAVGPQLAAQLEAGGGDDIRAWAHAELERFERGLSGLVRARCPDDTQRAKRDDFERRAALLRGLLDGPPG